jgi:hypothetical protein
LSNRSNATQLTPTASPATAVARSSSVKTRAAGPATISISTGSASTSSRPGAEQLTVAAPTLAAITCPSSSVANESSCW